MYSKFKELVSNEPFDFILRLIEEMPGGFFIYRADENEEVIHINKAAIRIFNCESYEEFSELTGNTFKGMVHPDDLERVEKSIAEQIARNVFKLDYVEYRIKQKGGSIRRISDYGHFVSSEKAGDLFYVFISDDTERIRKRADDLEMINNKLTKAYSREKKYRSAILYDALFFFEASLTKDKFITAVTQKADGQMFDIFSSVTPSENTKFSDFINFSSKSINQSRPDEYVHFFNNQRLIECFKNGEPEQTFDCDTIDIMGRKRVLHYIALLGSGADNDVSALIMAKDITEQTEKQRLLNISLRQAQSANIAKNTFLSNMSHDIRTPLNAIMGYADLIKMHYDERDKTDEYLENIKVSGNQLLSIIDESLEITRTEAGKSVLAETECHIVDLIAEVEKTVLPEMNAKSIHFTVDKSEITHYSVYIDIIRTKEILCQLLDNSAKYTDVNGTVLLKIKEECVSNTYSKFRFIVEDNGIGISEDFMEHMFEPFAREKNTTKSKVFGSGLGLTVVKSLAELMGGTVEAESSCGKGAKFTVSIMLKLLDKNIAPEADTTSKTHPIEGKRALLVDDNEINREIAQVLLTENGLYIETAEDGNIAVEIIKNSPPDHFDLILMDIQMPLMNGYDAAKAIRALDDKTLADIPIIALSANAYAEDQKRSLDAGMNAHAAKPIDIDKLIDVISEVLGKHRSESSINSENA